MKTNELKLSKTK